MKKLDTDKAVGETMFERLSKFEACRDDKNLDLKSVYMQSINESMKGISKELSNENLSPDDKKAKMRDLEGLKEALFTDVSQAKNNQYMALALEKVYEASPQNLNLDTVGGSNPNAQGTPPASNALKKEVAPKTKDKKSEFEKQKKLIGDIYESDNIAEEAKFYMGRQVSPSDDNIQSQSQRGHLPTILEDDDESMPAQPAPPAPVKDGASMPAPPRDPRRQFGGGVDRRDVEDEDDR